MGHKRQRQRASAVRTLSLSLPLAVLALAWTNGEAAASGGVSGDAASIVRREYGGVWNQRHQFRVLQENEAGVVNADAENREGSASAEPTAAPGTPAPEPTTAVPVTVTPAPAETPATTTPTPTTQAPATEAPTTAPTPAPTPTTVAPAPKESEAAETPAPTSSAPAPATSDTPAPTTQPPAPTTQPPAPNAETPGPTTQAPAPTTAAPTTAPPPATTAPTAPPAPPATTAAPPAPTPAPPPPTAAPAPPSTTAPVTPAPAPAPAPTTAAPTTKPPTAAPVTPSPSPSVTATPTPTVTTKAPTQTPKPSTTPSTGGAAGSGSGSKTPEPSVTPEASGNGKVNAPDLNDLPPIAGSGVISKSNRTSNDGAADSASNKTRSSDSDATKMSTLAIAGIILGVVGSVIVAIFFVHARRRRNHEKEFDSARQRQLDALFAPVGAPPIPTSGHPGAASISSSNGMTIAAAPASLTPRGQIPIVSSHRFKRGASGAGPGSKGRFTDRVMSEGSIAFKGRMDSIPQSPHRRSSDFGDSEYDNDSFLGSKAYSSDRPPSDRSGYSVRTSSNGTSNGDGYSTGPRSTGTSYARGSNDSKPLYFPAGMPQPRSSMVEMGLATTGPVPTVRASLSDEFFDSLPRGTAGDILVPLAKHDDAYTDYSVSSDEYGSPYDSRITRGDSNVSSSSNPNPWAMTGSEANLSARDFSVASSAAMSSDLPTSGRSDDSYYQSDGYDSDSQRSGRSDSYGYMDPRSTGEMSNRSFLSFSSDGRATGVATTPDRFSIEVEEGNI